MPPGLGGRGERLNHWNIAIPVRFTPVYHVSHVVKRTRVVHWYALVTSRQQLEHLEYRWVGWLDLDTDGLTVSAPFGVELWHADVRCR